MTYEELEAMSPEEKLARYLDNQPIIEEVEEWAKEIASLHLGQEADFKVEIGPEVTKYQWEFNTSCGCHPEYKMGEGQFPTLYLTMEWGAVNNAFRIDAEAQKAKEDAEAAEALRVSQIRLEKEKAEKARKQETEDRALLAKLKEKYDIP